MNTIVKITLLSMLAIILSIEPFLRIVDPLGGTRYYRDLAQVFAGYVGSERGFSMYPGLYQFSDWSALIERSGNRHTPDSKDVPCTIAFLGDSVAFGFGVDDSETFVNRLATQVDARLINTALPAYNSVNIRLTRDTVAADGYIYVAINNDDEPTRTRTNLYPVTSPPPQDSIRVYLDTLTRLNAEPVREVRRFARDLIALDRTDTLIVGFADDANWYKRIQQIVPDAVIVPQWTHNTSFIDGHPNPAGHAEIAGHLLPHVKAFVGRICK